LRSGSRPLGGSFVPLAYWLSALRHSAWLARSEPNLQLLRATNDLQGDRGPNGTPTELQVQCVDSIYRRVIHRNDQIA